MKKPKRKNSHPAQKTNPPRVFISYSWDDEEHKTRVLHLAQKLRADGIDAWLDRFEQFTFQGWSTWMIEEIERADFVLCVITKKYGESFARRAALQRNRGVKWEGAIIKQWIYDQGGENDKFIPIFFDERECARTPIPLNAHVDHSLIQPNGYDALYRLLTRQPTVQPQPLGKFRKLSALLQPVVFFHRLSRGNLPRLNCFFGREEQLETILRALDPNERTFIVLIDGVGGIGKTTLAIRAAEMVSESDYPQIIFASLKENTLEETGVKPVHEFRVRDYLGILNTIGSELGDDDIAKLPEEKRAVAVHKLLAKTRALLVLDNLETLSDTDQRRLIDFLRRIPLNTKVVLTSRRRTDLQAEIIRLDRLSWEAADQLMHVLARDRNPLLTASKEDRLKIYTETYGNPLVIRWVVAQLGRGRCESIAEALLFLAAGTKSGEEVLQYIFSDLLDSFTDEQVELLATLGAFSVAIPIHDLASLAGVPILAAQNALEELANRALVVSDPGVRYFAVTPMVADFVRGKRPKLIIEIGARLAEKAQAICSKNRALGEAHFDRLLDSWHFLEAGLPFVIAGPNERLQQVCEVMDGFLQAIGRWDELLSIMEEAERKAVDCNDFQNAARRAYRVGWIHQMRGQVEDVLHAAERSISHRKKVNQDAIEETHSIYLLGLGYRMKKTYAAALETFQSALSRYESLSPINEFIVGTLNEIGEVERLMRDFTQAESHCGKALKMAVALGFKEGIVCCDGNLAKIALDRGDPNRAIDRGLNALGLLEHVNRPDLSAEVHLCLAKGFLQSGSETDRQLAFAHARQAVQLYGRLHSPELSDAEQTLSDVQMSG